MKISHEVRIGIIVTIAIAATIWGINFLKGRNILKPIHGYVALYDDIGGLDVNSKIFMNGYKIGQVSEIYFNEGKSGGLTVILGVIKKYNIPLNSIAEIYSSDLMGSKAIRILKTDSMSYHIDGDTLISSFHMGIDQQIEAQLLPIKDKAEILMSRVDSVLQSLNYIFDEETAQSLRDAIKNLQEGSREMMAADSKLNRMIGNMESITENIRKNNNQITQVIQNFSAISDSLAKSELKSTIQRTNETLGETYEIVQKINNGEGTIGLLVNNDSLYYKLEATSRDLDLLLQDLQENPKKYVNVTVFGRKDKDKNKTK